MRRLVESCSSSRIGSRRGNTQDSELSTGPVVVAQSALTEAADDVAEEIGGARSRGPLWSSPEGARVQEPRTERAWVSAKRIENPRGRENSEDPRGSAWVVSLSFIRPFSRSFFFSTLCILLMLFPLRPPPRPSRLAFDSYLVKSVVLFYLFILFYFFVARGWCWGLVANWNGHGPSWEIRNAVTL